jgi:hypothetical protein
LASFADALSTHPPSRERVQQMASMVQESRLGQGQVTTDDFVTIRAKAKRIANKKGAKIS